MSLIKYNKIKIGLNGRFCTWMRGKLIEVFIAGRTMCIPEVHRVEEGEAWGIMKLQNGQQA